MTVRETIRKKFFFIIVIVLFLFLLGPPHFLLPLLIFYYRLGVGTHTRTYTRTQTCTHTYTHRYYIHAGVTKLFVCRDSTTPRSLRLLPRTRTHTHTNKNTIKNLNNDSPFFHRYLKITQAEFKDRNNNA